MQVKWLRRIAMRLYDCLLSNFSVRMTKITFTITIAVLISVGLHGQSKLISFEDLEVRKNEMGTPVYYYQGQTFSGKTHDQYERENISLEHHLDNGLLVLKEGFREGQKIEHAEFSGGVLDGDYFKYFDNGQKYVEHHYRNGRMHGMQYGWKKDGTVRFAARYENGLEMMRMNYPPPGRFDQIIRN